MILLSHVTDSPELTGAHPNHGDHVANVENSIGGRLHIVSGAEQFFAK